MRLRKSYPENPCTLVLGSVNKCDLNNMPKEARSQGIFDLIAEEKLKQLVKGNYESSDIRQG